MKKLLLLLLFIPFAFTLNSCAPLNITANPNVDKWIERTIPPSQVTTSGAMFFEEDLKTDIYNTSFVSYSVGGYIQGEDATYWYNKLYQDYGWRTNIDGGWSQISIDSPRIKKGYLYINLNKRVAVYMYTEGFRSFRVTLNEKTTE